MEPNDGLAGDLGEFARLPASSTFRLIDFDCVAIERASLHTPPVLVVSGLKSWVNLAVELRPRAYEKRPEYWQVEIVGTLPGYGVPGLVEYHATLPLTLCGTRGIEVVGASKAERRLVFHEVRAASNGHHA